MVCDLRVHAKHGLNTVFQIKKQARNAYDVPAKLTEEFFHKTYKNEIMHHQ